MLIILKRTEICELNTDISNEPTIKNFKEPSIFLYVDFMFLFICWLFGGVGFK